MCRSVRTVFVVLGLLVAGCGAGGDNTGAESPADVTTSTSQTTTSLVGATTTTEAGMQEVVEKAISDLANRLGIPERDIEVVEVKDVQWPDGALGCPEEGKMYTQAIVDGTRVILGAGERVYDYHSGSDGEPLLCPSGEKDGGYEFLPPPGNP